MTIDAARNAGWHALHWTKQNSPDILRTCVNDLPLRSCIETSRHNIVEVGVGKRSPRDFAVLSACACSRSACQRCAALYRDRVVPEVSRAVVLAGGGMRGDRFLA